jgi:hypothetical protein
MKCEIFKTHALLYIDGELHAEATYENEDVP